MVKDSLCGNRKACNVTTVSRHVTTDTLFKHKSADICTMQFLKDQWQSYKQKSVWSKLSDVFLFALIITMVVPDGRVFLQRLVLSTGVLSSASINEDKAVSDASWNWELTDLSGNTIQLNDLRGQVIFINHWGTFCPPCNAEMPGIIALMERVPADVNFVFASHEPAEKVSKHLQRHEWDIPAYIYTRSPGQELVVGSLPATFIIDKNSKVVHFTEGIKQWDTQNAQDLLTSLVNE